MSIEPKRRGTLRIARASLREAGKDPLTARPQACRWRRAAAARLLTRNRHCLACLLIDTGLGCPGFVTLLPC
jgi:hypothetical protein